jgi:organic radical activating enzyme
MNNLKAILVNNIDVHVTNSCNLHCHGCNHLANYGYGGSFKVKDLVDWIEPWTDRLYFKRISLLGGEPLLNPYLKNICIAYRNLFSPKDTKLRIITNGILIKKSPWLEELIQQHHVHVQVSLHVFTGKTKNQKLINQVKEGLALLEKWAGNAVPPADTSWGPYAEAKEKLNFQVFYQGVGANIKPFKHDNITESKRHCTCPTLQLYKGNLFKCAPIAYIGDVLEKLGRKDDPDWHPYLEYAPLTPDCTDDELVDFMEKQQQPEWTCKMCPPYSNVILSEEREISHKAIES